MTHRRRNAKEHFIDRAKQRSGIDDQTADLLFEELTTALKHQRYDVIELAADLPNIRCKVYRFKAFEEHRYCLVENGKDYPATFFTHDLLKKYTNREYESARKATHQHKVKSR